MDAQTNALLKEASSVLMALLALMTNAMRSVETALTWESFGATMETPYRVTDATPLATLNEGGTVQAGRPPLRTYALKSVGMALT